MQTLSGQFVPVDDNGRVIAPLSRVLVRSSQGNKYVMDVENVVQLFPGLWSITGASTFDQIHYTFKVSGMGIEVDDLATMTVVGSLEARAFVEKTEKGYCVKSPKNKNWNGGCYPTKGEADKRLEQVEMFKAMGAKSVESLNGEMTVTIPGAVDIIDDTELPSKSMDLTVEAEELTVEPASEVPEEVGPDFPPNTEPIGKAPTHGNARIEQLNDMWNAGVKLPSGLEMVSDKGIAKLYEVWQSEYQKVAEADLQTWWREHVNELANSGTME